MPNYILLRMTTRYRRKSKGYASREGMSAVMNQLLTATKLQQTSGEPDSPDVKFPPYKRNKVYTFRESFVNAITASTTVETDGAINFKLNQLPNATPIAQMFDQYRILCIRCEFQPPSTTQAGAPIYTVLDYDDSNTITANSCLAYDTCKTSPPGAYFERVFIPKVNYALYNASGTVTDASAATSPWIDVAGPDVPHYGIKFAIPASTTANTWSVRCTFHYQVKFNR